MRSSRYIFLFAVALAVAVSVSAQVYDSYVIPAVGNTPGANGTVWATSLNIFNPQLSRSLTVYVAYLPTPHQPIQSVTIEDIPPNANFSRSNVVAQLFHTNGTGSLLVTTLPPGFTGDDSDFLDHSFVVTTTTYNNSIHGTFGQLVPGTLNGLESDGITSIAHGITDTASSTTGFRTNVGAVNLGDFSVTLEVSVYDGDGNTLADRIPFDVPSMSFVQDRLPVNVTNGTVEFSLIDHDPDHNAVVFPYTSMIDNLSGDPAYQNPILLADPAILLKDGKSPLARINQRMDPAVVRAVFSKATSVGVIDGRSSTP